MILLTLAVLLGASITLVGSVMAGIAAEGEKHAGMGLTLIGAVIYGIAGGLLWHWAVALTTAVMFLALAFAVFATKEALNG